MAAMRFLDVSKKETSNERGITLKQIIILLRLSEYCRNNPLDFVLGIIQLYSLHLWRIIVNYGHRKCSTNQITIINQ